MAHVGEKHHKAKVTEDDVILMRKLFAERHRLLEKANELTIEKIAEKFDLGYGACRDAIYRETWKHVVDDCVYGVDDNRQKI